MRRISYLFAIVIVLSILSACNLRDKEDSSYAGLTQDQREALDLFKLTNISIGKNTYQIQRLIDGVSSGPVTTIVRYSEGGRLRTDTIVGDVETRTYLLGAKMTSCRKSSEDAWSCRDIPQNQNRSQTFLENPSLFAVTRDGETIAQSLTGTCFKIESLLDESEKQRVCISANGVIVANEFINSQGTIKQILIKREATISDSDFEIPRN